MHNGLQRPPGTLLQTFEGVDGLWCCHLVVIHRTEHMLTLQATNNQLLSTIMIQLQDTRSVIAC